MSKRGESVPPKATYLVTLSESARASVDEIASDIRAAGIEVADIFPLGGVIQVEATGAEMARLRLIDGVSTVETEPTLRAF